MKKILIYVRPFSKELFTDVIFGAIPDAEITYFSDFKECADFWTGDFIYNSALDDKCEESIDTINDIISRDRTLRNRLKRESQMLVTRFLNGADKLFSDNKFDYFITLNVDCYSIDILLRMAHKYNVKAISLLGSFLSGYAWFNLRGERNPLNREVTNDEAEHVLNSLTKKYYLPPSETKHVKQKHGDIIWFYYRRRAIEELYYPLLRIFKKDKWNCFYNMCNWEGTKLSNYYNAKFESMFKHIEELHIDENTVYFPMHFIPEATTDYWCDDIAQYGYNQYVLNVIEKSSSQVKWLVKEHPAMYGKRELSFYRKLMEYPNVTVVHPLDRSNELLELVSNVVVDNGTVGVEAAIRGKRVLALGRNYYQQLHPNVIRVDRITLEDLRIPLEDYDNLVFIKELLDGLFQSDYRNGKDQGKCNKDQLINGFKQLLRSNGWE